MNSSTCAHVLTAPRVSRFSMRMMYLRHLLKSALLVRRRRALRDFGTESSGCMYRICPDGLGPSSVVYSGGVGKDISFEHDLVKHFNCRITLVDPSPIGVATMQLPQHQIPQLNFQPVGLAGHCGSLRLAPPFTEEGDSWFSNDNPAATIEVRCLDLATLMKQQQHRRIDLLKLDIEGAEYGVLDQMLSERIPVRQIVVEFHDGILPGFRLSQSLRMIYRLLRHGYELIVESGNTHTFYWKGAWNEPAVSEPGPCCVRRP